MDNKVNYTVVGLFVIVLISVAILIFLWLTSMKHDRYTKVYLTYMREEVAGLNPQSPVRYNGVKVGYVQRIDLNNKDPQQVMITMLLAENTPVTTSTIAQLNSEGITGIEYIGLKALTPAAPPLYAKPGKKYPVIPSEPSLLMKLSTAVQEVTKSVTELSSDVKQVFDQQNRDALRNSLSNVERVTGILTANAQQINSSLKSMDKLLANSAKASNDLPQITKQLKSTLTQVKKAAHSIEITGVSVSNTMQTTQTSFQQLVPGANSLIQHLNNLAVTLQQVGVQVQENPAVLVRGSVPAAPGPGER